MCFQNIFIGFLSNPFISLEKQVQDISAPLSSSWTWFMKLAKLDPFRAISKWDDGYKSSSRKPIGVSSHFWTSFSKDKYLL